MTAAEMPEVRASWDALYAGMWHEGEASTPILLETRMVVYTDDSWSISTHDPHDPLRGFTESHPTGGEAQIDRYRQMILLGERVATAVAVAGFLAIADLWPMLAFLHVLHLR